MSIIKQCYICKNKFKVKPYRKKKAKYCSSLCYGKSLQGKCNLGTLQNLRIMAKHRIGKKYPKWLKERISKGRLKSFLCKGTIPWNKGKKFPQFSGKNHPNWKGGKPKCINCNKQLKNPYAKRCNSCAHKGKRSYLWKGGKSFEFYPEIFNQQLKDRIRTRDNFHCQSCGVPELECNERLHIHHIDYNKKNCKENNLISLCRKCHTKTLSKRNHWIEYFTNSNLQYIKENNK